MQWLEDIIESLPAQYEELARLYLPILRRMGREEVMSWLFKLSNGHAMNDLIAEKMTTPELIADQERSNEMLKALNKDNADQVDLGWQIIGMLLSIAFNKIES